MTDHDFIAALVSRHTECGLDNESPNGVGDEIPEMCARGRIPPGGEYTERERENEHKRDAKLDTDLSSNLIYSQSTTGNYQKVRM